MKHAKFGGLLAISAFAASTLAGNAPTPQDISKLVAEGRDNSRVMATLRDLCDIGPRLTGSPNLLRAQKWAVGEFKKYGLQNARLEEWGDVPVGFERGARQVGRMVTPFEYPITFTTPCWMPGTNGRITGEAILAPKTMAELEGMRGRLKGAFLVMPQAVSMRGAAAASTDEQKQLEAEIAKSGIAAKIYGTRDDRVHSFGTWREKSFDKRPTETQIVVARPDYDRIVRNVEYGRKPKLEFDIENKWFKGPIKQYNVIADLPGTDLKDEVVIVCGHLDSWNSPGSQGACDNGTGSSVTLEAARILTQAKVKPRRTIRFILWSGEEQGLLGSRAYVEKHKAELDKIVAVLNDDGGTNYQGGYVATANQKSILEAAMAPTIAAFPDLPMKLDIVERPSPGGSSDHAPFQWAGVPAYFTKEVGRADYGKVWHTQYDRYESAIPEYLVQSATNHALVGFHLATIDEKLPRFPVQNRTTTREQLNHALAVGADRMYLDPRLQLAHGHDDGHDHEDDYILELIDRLKRFVQILGIGR